MAIQGHMVKTALLPLLTQHTQLGHSHRQHPDTVRATGEMPALEQHPRAWAGREVQWVLPGSALLTISPKQELTQSTQLGLPAETFMQPEASILASFSLSSWHPSKVALGFHLKLSDHGKGLLVCLTLSYSLEIPQYFLQHPPTAQSVFSSRTICRRFTSFFPELLALPTMDLQTC